VSTTAFQRNRRILVIDDNRAIHDDFRKILCGGESQGGGLEATEAALFGESAAAEAKSTFEIASAFQGQEGLAQVEHALQNNARFAMAFVDVRMPPGWDGIETTMRIWKADPDLQIVICTAYSDYSWDEVIAKVGQSDRMVILKKPFDTVEVLQLAHALTEKWQLLQEAKQRFADLEKLVDERARELKTTNAHLEKEIVEHKRAAEALHESEKRYEVLFKSNPLPMWVYDPEVRRFTAVNETAVQNYGYSAEEFLAMTIGDLHPDDERPKLLEHIERTRNEPWAMTTWKHRKKDKAIMDVEVVSRLASLSGRPVRLVLAQDITQRKQAEDRIREQAMLLDMASDAIFVRDLEGRIHFWNQGAERLYGWTAAEAAAGGVTKTLTEDIFSQAAAQAVLMEKGEWSGEIQRVTRDGSKLTVNSRWTLLRGAGSGPAKVLTIDTDITEKKRLQSQFLRTQRMEAIGTLATGMAHDLNNILAPVMMATEVLRWPLPPKEFDETITRIEGSVKRGAEIIKQVLAFGRGAEGKRALLAPRKLVDEIVTMIRQTFPKTVTVNREVAEDLWNVEGDRTQMQQVLLNLCVNARDAMSEGGTLTLDAANTRLGDPQPGQGPELKAGPYVVIRVADTGAGIPPEILDRIFDPFFTTKSHGKGTGLGLSTAIGIVKGHSGTITVTSEPGKGSVFKVFLPAFPGTCASDTTFEAKPESLPRGNGDMILMVDDESEILKANQKILERYNYRVLIAGDGAEGLAAFAHNRKSIKAIVTDIMMPQVDGLGLIRAVKKLDSDVPIIASSGLSRNLGQGSANPELEALRVDKFLMKPYTADVLLRTLNDVLRQSQPS
jgi:two-component system cell cycle sensor histidine kinase/response regulator CckA